MLDVSIKGIEKLKADVEAMNKQSETVLKRTVNEFNTRAPAWIAKAITTTYNIKAAEVKKAMQSKRGRERLTFGEVKIKGHVVANASIEVSGRRLTLSHFLSSPRRIPKKRQKNRSVVPVSGTDGGEFYTLHQLAPYQVNVEVRRGNGRVVRGTSGMPVGLMRSGSSLLPFQREGAARTPINIFHTVSIPQMVGDESVSAEIHRSIEENMGKRLKHHMKQVMK